MRTIILASYKVPNGLSGIRGADEGDALSLAAEAFSRKNYTRTLQLLKHLPDNDRQEALSLRAHAHFGVGNFAVAARDFSELEKGGIYRREAQWFGVLASLASSQKDKAVALKALAAISQDDKHPYQAEARALKHALK